MKHSRYYWFFALLVALALAGCNGGNSSSNSSVNNPSGSGDPTSPSTPDPTSPPATALVPVAGEGYAQKGPFQTGTTVTVQGLNADGSLSGDTWATETQADGKISFDGIGWEGLAMVTVTGHYFNEIDGTFSPAPFELRAVMNVTDTALVGNVNLFTHIAARYYEYWLPQDYGYEELRGYVDDYLMTWFGLATRPENLNLLDSIDPETDRDSYMLLLYSAAMASINLTQEELDALAEDFAVTDAGWVEDWPDGTGKDALTRLFNEAQNNEESLIAAARQNLQAQFGRSVSAFDAGVNRVAGTICIYAGLLCEAGDLADVPIGNVPNDVPVNINYAGSYGIKLDFNDNGSGVTAVFARTPGAPSIASASGTASSFLEFMTPPVEGNQRYNLRLVSSSDKTASSISLFALSQGSESDPYPIRVGDNTVRVGLEWGTNRNTDSYFHLIAGPGRYEFTIQDFTCGTSETPVVVRGYEWEWDIREPLPEGETTTSPFDTLPTVIADDNTCSHQFELENDTQPNRLYIYVEALGIRDSTINANRAIREDFTIRVRRL